MNSLSRAIIALLHNAWKTCFVFSSFAELRSRGPKGPRGGRGLGLSNALPRPVLALQRSVLHVLHNLPIMFEVSHVVVQPFLNPLLFGL